MFSIGVSSTEKLIIYAAKLEKYITNDAAVIVHKTI